MHVYKVIFNCHEAFLTCHKVFHIIKRFLVPRCKLLSYSFVVSSYRTLVCVMMLSRKADETIKTTDICGWLGNRPVKNVTCFWGACFYPQAEMWCPRKSNSVQKRVVFIWLQYRPAFLRASRIMLMFWLLIHLIHIHFTSKWILL